MVFVAPFAYVFYWVAARLARSEKKRKSYATKAAIVAGMTWARRRPRYASLSAMWASSGDELFEHRLGPAAMGQPTGTVVRDVVVVDSFYEDPDSVRRWAVALDYDSYAPRWHSSALEVRPSRLTGKGRRLAPPAVRARFEAMLGQRIDESTWETAGDGWNGAFHYKTGGYLRGYGSSIHNHVGRDEDVRPGGWSGLVYLSPNAPRWAGTSIWMDRRTGKCWTLESEYRSAPTDFEMILDIENVYNRLVLFQGSVFHLAHDGWGSNLSNSRLFQTFFFNIAYSGGLPQWGADRGDPAFLAPPGDRSGLVTRHGLEP